MVESLASKEELPAIKDTFCQHHWIIETPQGVTSSGECKNCHEVREFQNGADDFRKNWGYYGGGWDGNNPRLGGLPIENLARNEP
ncbi:MAG: hypothetical protein Q8P25_02940 [Candidatus Curtissbacteria bacterium]|nr:hypothetical protein [Candidatus Curtissbacteria bacterium]